MRDIGAAKPGVRRPASSFATAAGASALGRRPHLTGVDKARVVTRAVGWRGGSLVRRAGRRLTR